MKVGDDMSAHRLRSWYDDDARILTSIVFLKAKVHLGSCAQSPVSFILSMHNPRPKTSKPRDQDLPLKSHQ
jgi:hypothetical protein